jgi:hypothetical protein
VGNRTHASAHRGREEEDKPLADKWLRRPKDFRARIISRIGNYSPTRRLRDNCALAGCEAALDRELLGIIGEQ